MAKEQEGELIKGVGFLEQIARAESDIQISTAKKYPRNVTVARQKIRSTALRDAKTASECFYALSRTDKNGNAVPIEGPSIRLAEIIANCWGNLRVATRVLEEGEKFVTVSAIAHDLESNLAVSSEVRRRITTSKGNRYSDDMVEVTIRAASAIAFRNAVLKVVPQSEWVEVYEEALDKSKVSPQAGKAGDSIEERRTRALKVFGGFGVTVEQILFKLGRKTISDITTDDLALLTGIRNALREESTTIEEQFPEANEEPEPPRRSPGVRNQRPLNLNPEDEMPIDEPGSNG